MNMINSTGEKKSAFIALLLLGVCILTFSNSLGNPFLMDDHALVTRNKAIKDPGFLQIGQGHLRADSPPVYFRPATHLFNLIPYLIFGINSLGFHIFNLFLFYLACLSVYILFKCLLNNGNLALLISLLFCVHPINGILVNYLTASGYSVLIICINFAIVCSLRFWENPRKIFFWLLSHTLFAFALLSHETAIMFPLYLSSALYFLKKQNLKSVIYKTFSYYILVAAYLLLRNHVTNNQISMLAGVARFHLSIPQFIAYFENLIFFYLKNMILLKDIVLIWASPAVAGLLAAKILICFLFLVLLIYLPYKYWGKNEKSFALSWIIFNWLPLTLACFSRPNLGIIIEPHWLFYSTMGFFCLISLILVELSRKINRPLIYAVCLILLSSYFISSRYYNSLWNNEKTYCRYMLSLSPRMELPLFWLANAYLYEGSFAEAEHYFKEAETGSFSDWYIYINLGRIKHSQGNLQEAAEYYLKSLKINPNSAEAYTNLAAILIEKKEFPKAEKFLRKAVDLDYYAVDARKNLIYIYALTERKPEALKVLKEIQQIDPNDPYIQQKLPFLNAPVN